MKIALLEDKAIKDYNGNNIGTFTGTIWFTHDLTHIIFAIGDAVFSDTVKSPVKVNDLKVDLMSDMETVYCLYTRG